MNRRTVDLLDRAAIIAVIAVAIWIFINWVEWISANDAHVARVIQCEQAGGIACR
jgi:hypothetical protein